MIHSLLHSYIHSAYNSSNVSLIQTNSWSETHIVCHSWQTGGQVTGDYIQPHSQAVLGTKLGSHGVGRKTKSLSGFSRWGTTIKQFDCKLVDGLGTRLSATGSDHFEHSMCLCSLNFFLICDVVTSWVEEIWHSKRPAETSLERRPPQPSKRRGSVYKTKLRLDAIWATCIHTVASEANQDKMLQCINMNRRTSSHNQTYLHFMELFLKHH